MKAKNSLIKPARVPEAVGGIQVNYCKNPICQNFGIPASDKSTRKNVNDGYTASGGGTSVHALRCKFCGESPAIKSNLAIYEELTRLLDDLKTAPTPSCPDSQCANHIIPVNAGKGHYQSFGKAASGSKRYLCKAP